jgi:hypothetical protein
MRTNPFESQLERLARTLTEQFGVAVVCQGDQAYTDGKTIVLPSLPEPLEEGLERMMVGYLDHEIAHVAFSDFKQVKQFNKKHRGFEAMRRILIERVRAKGALKRGGNPERLRLYQDPLASDDLSTVLLDLDGAHGQPRKHPTRGLRTSRVAQ